MFNITKEVNRLPATPKSRLTKKMKVYELELRLKDCFPAKNEKEAKEEMVKRLRCVLADDSDILWRLCCKLYGEYPCSI